jgi:hypothetical protein
MTLFAIRPPLWEKGTILSTIDGIRPLLASWDRIDHPSQVRLRKYLESLIARVGQLPSDDFFYLDLTVDVQFADRLRRHYDVENYLTPLFGAKYFNHRRFTRVVGRKRVGGGSRLEVGRIAPESSLLSDNAWSTVTMNVGPGQKWKHRLRDELSTGHAPIDESKFVELLISWRVSSRRNWTTLWKPTIDAMGPILGSAGPGLFNPKDDRITSLALHRIVDDAVGNDIQLSMWWRSL